MLLVRHPCICVSTCSKAIATPVSYPFSPGLTCAAERTAHLMQAMYLRKVLCTSAPQLQLRDTLPSCRSCCSCGVPRPTQRPLTPASPAGPYDSPRPFTSVVKTNKAQKSNIITVELFDAWPLCYQSSFSLSICWSLFLSAAAIAAAEPVTTLLLVILQHEAV